MFINLPKAIFRLLSLALPLLVLCGCAAPVPPPSATIPAITALPLPSETPTVMPQPTLASTEMPTLEPFPSGQTRVDAVYCSTPGGSPLLMDIYFPVGEAASYPAVVFFHGGGLESGDKKNLVPLPDPTRLVKGGNVFVSVNYRLAPDNKFPAQIVDAKCALRSLRAHAREYFVDPERMAAMGYSSGAHLAALLATSGDPQQEGGVPEWSGGLYPEQSSRVQAAVILSGPAQGEGVLPGANQGWLEEVYGTSDTSSAVIQKAAPLAYVSPDDPPFLILHGVDDTVIPVGQAQMLEKALRENGVDVEFIPVMGAGHDILAPWAQTMPSYDEQIQRIQEFLTRVLSPRS